MAALFLKGRKPCSTLYQIGKGMCHFSCHLPVMRRAPMIMAQAQTQISFPVEIGALALADSSFLLSQAKSANTLMTRIAEKFNIAEILPRHIKTSNMLLRYRAG